MPRYTLSILILFLVPVFAVAATEEGSIQHQSLVSYEYNSRPSDWETKTIKAKAQEACKYAFSMMRRSADALFTCDEIGSGDGSDRTIFYKLSPKSDDASIDYAPSLASLRIFAMYHFRSDGAVPYYKKGIFTNSWVRDQYRRVVGEAESAEDLYIMCLVSVVDAANNVDLHIISRNSLHSTETSWILRSAFGLFESPQDRLETQLCLLLQKMTLPSPPKSVAKRLIEVEEALAALKEEK